METLLGHLSSRHKLATSGCGSGLRYTVDKGILTAEQRLGYERDGFIVVKGLVAQDQLDVYRERFKNICGGTVKVRPDRHCVCVLRSVHSGAWADTDERCGHCQI